MGFLHRRQHVDWVDLSLDSAFTMALLDDTWAWRQRLVINLRFIAPSHIGVESAYQIELPPELLQDFALPASVKSVRALVPLTTRPKELLLNFDLRGPDAAPPTY